MKQENKTEYIIIIILLFILFSILLIGLTVAFNKIDKLEKQAIEYGHAYYDSSKQFKWIEKGESK